MATTISVSQELLSKLKERKMYDKESYEEVIWDALEDSMELSEETKKSNFAKKNKFLGTLRFRAKALTLT